jgi:hypothetical protein
METAALHLLDLILPNGILTWFDVTESEKTADELHVTLVEKNIPPLTEEDRGKKVQSKGFTNITVTDFPLRGRRVLLTFRRRYWHVEGRDDLLKRDLTLCASGTQLEKEFADFLKEDSGNTGVLSEFYRGVS